DGVSDVCPSDPGAATAAEHDPAGRGDEGGPAQPANRLVGVPAVAAHSALAAVGAAAATRVLVVDHRVVGGGTGAPVAWSAARRVPQRIPIRAGAGRCPADRV